MGFHILIGVAAAVLAIANAAVAADEAQHKPDDMVNMPPFQHWGAFNVGTKVTQKQVVSLPDGRKLEQVIVQRLLKNAPSTSWSRPSSRTTPGTSQRLPARSRRIRPRSGWATWG